jgi:F0F1-type ATP synthase assembly protein I
MRITNFSRSQRMAIVQGILCLVSVIAVMQLWVFTATMEAYLGGDESFVLPAALASISALI